MTKKELIEALSDYNDSDEVLVEDMRYYSYEFFVRNVSLNKVSWSVCAGKKSPVLYMDSDTLVTAVTDNSSCCQTCKHYGIPEHGPLKGCKLGSEIEDRCETFWYYEFFNSKQ